MTRLPEQRINVHGLEFYVDNTSQAHQETFVLLTEQGYRLRSLSVYGDPDDARYAAVWLKELGPDWVSCHGQTRVELQRFLSEWTPKGFQPTIISATGSNEAAQFAAVCERKATPTIVRFDLSASAFISQCDWARHHAYRLTWVAVYGTATNAIYAGIWEKNDDNIEWGYRIGEGAETIQNNLDLLDRSGSQLQLITRSAAADSYASIWRAVATNRWWEDHGLTPDEFSSAAKQYQERGIFPITLQVTKVGNQAQLAVIWSYLPLGWSEQTTMCALGSVGVQAAESVNQPGEYEWNALGQSRAGFVTHSPTNTDFIKHCHTLNIRCFPYVTFTMAPTPTPMRVIRGAKDAPVQAISQDPPLTHPRDYKSNYYQGINFDIRDDFFFVDSSGKRVDFTGQNGGPLLDGINFLLYPGGSWVCPNVQEYQDAMVDWVDRLMLWGADGVIIDQVGIMRAGYPVPGALEQCYGDQRGLHKHIHGGTTTQAYKPQNLAYKQLLGRVRQTIKKHKPDGALLANASQPQSDPAWMPPEFWPEIDAVMIEGYLSHLQPRVPPLRTKKAKGADGKMSTLFALDWNWWHSESQKAALRKHDGKTTLAYCVLDQSIYTIRYFEEFYQERYPVPPDSAKQDQLDYRNHVTPIADTIALNSFAARREYAFLTYATAALSGLTWCISGPISRPEYADLFRIRLGYPQTAEAQCGGRLRFVWYRLFENGLVIVNADPGNAVDVPIEILAPVSPGQRLIDVFVSEVATSLSAAKAVENMDEAVFTRTTYTNVTITGSLTIPRLAGRVYLFATDTIFSNGGRTTSL